MCLSNLKNNPTELASFTHQAALNPLISDELLIEICNGSQKFKISRICTNLVRLAKIKELLGSKSYTKLISVIAFPFGSIPQELKISEAQWASNQGADELDIVPNYLALVQGKTNIFAEEIAQICEIGLPVRSILDINLPREKLYLSIEASIDAGVYGVQIGNGFGLPISKEQIKEISQLGKGRAEIKAVGGIKTLVHAIELLEAGATELGTSFGIELIQQIEAESIN
tara:strand:+ start:9916 stop:10599 length:684 start_codon:yes stop_codon:yes gene_type:complete